MAANRYARISYRPEGAKRRRTICLRNPTPTKLLGVACTTGIEVNRDGDEVTGRVGGKLADQKQHIIADELIVTRTEMVMDLHYAMLVEAGTETEV